jgi:hypothetical protein
LPALRTLPPGEELQVFDLSEDHLGLDEYDVANQGLISHHFYWEAGGRFVRLSPPCRYVWPRSST